jgi:hypothetical protein
VAANLAACWACARGDRQRVVGRRLGLRAVRAALGSQEGLKRVACLYQRGDVGGEVSIRSL